MKNNQPRLTMVPPMLRGLVVPAPAPVPQKHADGCECAICAMRRGIEELRKLRDDNMRLADIQRRETNINTQHDRTA